jgi:hypothetical protein
MEGRKEEKKVTGGRWRKEEGRREAKRRGGRKVKDGRKREAKRSEAKRRQKGEGRKEGRGRKEDQGHCVVPCSKSEYWIKCQHSTNENSKKY